MGAGCSRPSPNAIISPEERAVFDDLYGKGCKVEDAAQRAVTLAQLERIVAHVVRRCEAEEWTGLRFGDVGGLRPVPPEQGGGDAGGPGTRVFLMAERVNLYDVDAHVIRPATASRKCSLMEVMAGGKQTPTWFVSHWWGESIGLFVTCLRAHAKDRGLGTWTGQRNSTNGLEQTDPHFGQGDFAPSERACYWVCAYANNQYDLGTAVTEDPKETSFYRAMCLAGGTVSVVDGGGMCFTRVWCCFEIYTSLISHALERDYRYDIYTAQKNHFGEAVGLVDGLTIYDQRGGAGLAQQYKATRESFFPLALLESSLEVSLERGQASVEADRRHILNALAGCADLGAEPLLEHPNYTAANDVLRGRLASSTPVPCLLNAESLRSLFLSALPRSRGVTVIAANFNMSDKLTGEILQKFIEALPETVTHLRLGEIHPGLDPLPYDQLDGLANLQELELYHCRGFTLDDFNAGDRVWVEETCPRPNTQILRPKPAAGAAP